MRFRKYQAVAALLDGLPTGSRIADLGAGSCDVSTFLSYMGYQVIAVDDLGDPGHYLKREMIDKFAQDAGVEIIYQDMTMPLPLENMDAVIMIDVMEHLANPRPALNSAVSIIRPGGRLVVLQPNLAALSKRLKLLVGRAPSVSAGYMYWHRGEFRSHIREYTAPELMQILKFHGMEEIRTSYFNRMVDEVPGFVAKVYDKISNLWPGWRDTAAVVAKKPVEWRLVEENADQAERFKS